MRLKKRNILGMDSNCCSGINKKSPLDFWFKRANRKRILTKFLGFDYGYFSCINNILCWAP